MRLFPSKGNNFFLQNIRFEDQMVFTVKSQKPSEHHGYCMTASLQHTAGASRKKSWSANPSLGGGHGSRLQYGQRDQSNWGGGRQAQGAGQCPQTAQESAGSQEQAQLNFFTWVNKCFGTQTRAVGPIAPLPLHHTQPCAFCPGEGDIPQLQSRGIPPHSTATVSSGLPPRWFSLQ